MRIIRNGILFDVVLTKSPLFGTLSVLRKSVATVAPGATLVKLHLQDERPKVPHDMPVQVVRKMQDGVFATGGMITADKDTIV